VLSINPTFRSIRPLAIGVVFGLSLFAAQAQAAVYTLDTFLFSNDLGNSGDATEEAALETFLKADVTMDDKVITNVASKDEAGNWYIDVAPDEPGYFLLKFGTGPGTADHYYFQNIGELTKLVFTNDQVGGLIGTGTAAMHLSHYVTYNGDGGGDPTGGNVPEPGTLALAGLGLLAAVAASRRKRG
jgi:hypothetical protein